MALCATLLTLDLSLSISGETDPREFVNLPAAERDPISCVWASGFPFLVMLGGRWLDWYLRDSGGPMAECCEAIDANATCPRNGRQTSLSRAFQCCSPSLACGLCRWMWSINTSVAHTLIGLNDSGAEPQIHRDRSRCHSKAAATRNPTETAPSTPTH